MITITYYTEKRRKVYVTVVQVEAQSVTLACFSTRSLSDFTPDTLVVPLKTKNFHASLSSISP